MVQDIRGKPVSEEEVAKGLGFANVQEFRRWDTEQGIKIGELEYALKHAEDERDNFQHIARKMMAVLDRIKPTLTDRLQVLAIDVVCGREVDWNHEVKDWWPSRRSNSDGQKASVSGVESGVANSSTSGREAEGGDFADGDHPNSKDTEADEVAGQEGLRD